MFDFTDHTLNWIIAVAEVAILLFMVWEKYEPLLRGKPLSGTVTARTGTFRLFWRLWDNRVLIVAIFGLGFIAWVNFGRTPTQSERDQELDNLKRDLAIAQHPRENPLDTPTWLRLNFNPTSAVSI